MGAALLQHQRRSALARVLGLCIACGVSISVLAQELGPMPVQMRADSQSASSTDREAVPAQAGASIPASERQPLGASSTKPVAWSTQPTNNPTPAQNPASLAGLVRTMLSLAGVVAIIVGLAYVIKRAARGSGGLMNQLGAGGRAPSGVLSILGRYPVARGTTLVLLKADRRVLLLCQTAGKGFTSGCTMQTLSEFTDPEDVASILLKTRDEEETSLAQRFEAMLSREDEAATRALGGVSASQKPVTPRPAPSRAARAAAKQPDAVMRPTPIPSDPRAQIGRDPDRLNARAEAPVRNGVKPAPGGPLLRGVVA